MLKDNIQKAIDVLKKVDSNQDNDVTIEEIKSAQNLTTKEKELLNTTFGLVDGNFKNEQGRYGSCSLLSKINF